jgi:MFS superfamily sulfate permease-like transporter
MDPGSVAASGLIIGAFFLVVGATGLVSRIARVLPDSVAAGLQLGLGLSLAALGVRLMGKTPWLGVATCVLMIGLMRHRRMPVALVAVVAGAVTGVLSGASPPPPALALGLHLPHLIWPTLAQALNGLEHAVLPQIPLTLTNAIIVTAAVSRQLFPGRADAVTERRLAITTGLGNLLAAPFGGYMMCHGAGGVTGHFRFGARTATAPLVIGAIFLALGLFLGPSGLGLLRTVPDAVLGGLLTFSGVDLAVSSRPGRFKDEDLFLVLLMAAIGVAINPAAAFVVGLPLAYGIRRHWVRI